VHGELVILVQQQPLLLARFARLAERTISTGVGPGAHEHEPATQLLALQIEMQLTGLDRTPGILAVARPPGAGVPDDHIAAPVPAHRDDALEIEVVQRVVLDMKCRAAHHGIERGPFGHRPADQHPVDLQAQVVVQPPGPVPLHHEAPAIHVGHRTAPGCSRSHACGGSPPAPNSRIASGAQH